MPIFLILVSNSVHRSQWTTRALGIVLFIHYERYLIIVIALPLSILHIVLDRIQNFLSIGDSSVLSSLSRNWTE